jgi:DNA polymerase I-like protein with 3'-5' exonuclease and polymerase domains
MKLVFDIETDGLYQDSKNIWCMVAIDEDDNSYSFKQDEIDKGIELLKSADVIIGHNIIGFDVPVIKKLTGVDLYQHTKVLDTLTLSRLFHPTREGGHSLEKWGYKLNYHKAEQPEFDCYSDDMLDYCLRDVKLNKLVLNHLRKESVGFSKECIELEHQVCRILQQQYENGFVFDEKNAMLLLSSLNKRKAEVEDEVHATFKPKWVDVKEVIPKLKKDGKLSKSGLTNIEYEERVFTNDTTPFMRKELKEFNLGSRQQIGEYLKDFGWKPNRFTPTGQPIVDEGTLNKITHIHEAQLIAEYLLLQKRAAQVESWIDACHEDNKVHGSIISTGAITGRMTHRNPNMAQVPAVYSPYGLECRACWTVPEGYKLVGIDASGLELRMLAHYMADKEYINEIINGDIHTTNQKFAGLKSRDEAKTFIYALIYGAGDEKIGKIISGNKQTGRKLRERFLSSLPALKSLKQRVERAAKKDYLRGLDGRKIYVRHRHASLNTLLQGGGAIVMKKAMCILQDLINLNTFDAKFVANIHDEWQLQVKESQADCVGRLGVSSIRNAGLHFNMRCPLTGEYKIGGNWSETH